VTTERDMANDTDDSSTRRALRRCTELGPRVLKRNVSMDGEFAGPTKMRVDTAEKALKTWLGCRPRLRPN